MHIVYKITNKINGRYYIGKTNQRDWDNGYMGSGLTIKKALKKYGRDSFQRTILATFNTSKEAFNYEEKLLDKKTLSDPLIYNIDSGGCGYNSGESHPCYGVTGQQHPAYGQTGYWTGKKRPDMSLKHTGKGNPRYGVKSPISEQTKQSIRQTMTGVKHTPDRIAKIQLGKLKKKMQTLDNPVKPALLLIPIKDN